MHNSHAGVRTDVKQQAVASDQQVCTRSRGTRERDVVIRIAGDNLMTGTFVSTEQDAR